MDNIKALIITILLAVGGIITFAIGAALTVLAFIGSIFVGIAGMFVLIFVFVKEATSRN